MGYLDQFWGPVAGLLYALLLPGHMLVLLFIDWPHRGQAGASVIYYATMVIYDNLKKGTLRGNLSKKWYITMAFFGL